MLSPTDSSPTLITPIARRTLAIVGTDTDAGKTIVSTALAAYWAQHGSASEVALVKPIQSGVGDIERYGEIFGDTIETVNSIYLRDPLARRSRRNVRASRSILAWRGVIFRRSPHGDRG